MPSAPSDRRPVTGGLQTVLLARPACQIARLGPRKFKCPAKVNSTLPALRAAATRRLRPETPHCGLVSAKVLPAAKRLYGVFAPPHPWIW